MVDGEVERRIEALERLAEGNARAVEDAVKEVRRHTARIRRRQVEVLTRVYELGFRAGRGESISAPDLVGVNLLRVVAGDA